MSESNPLQATTALRLDEGWEAALEVLERFLPREGADQTPLVAVGLNKAFGGIQAVRDVSLEVQSDCLAGLIGPNGAGKTTFFNMVNGFEVMDRGTVSLFGQDVTNAPPWTRARRGMSRTFQANHIDLDQTVLDNLMAGAHLHIRGGLIGATLRTRSSWSSEERARVTARAVGRLLGLDQYLDTLAGPLDFGAQRRIEIGRSLMSGPRLLLLDEPTAGLDFFEAMEVIGLVRRLQQDLKIAVLLIEHFIEAVFEHSDVVHVLVEGALVASGTPVEVAADPTVRGAYLGEKGQH